LLITDDIWEGLFNKGRVNSARIKAFPHNYPSIWNDIKQEGLSISECIWLDRNEYGGCKECEKQTAWRSLREGYKPYCSSQCSYKSKERTDKIKESLLKLNKTEIVNKAKETSIKNWGVENPSKNGVVKQKRKETTIEKWGVENVFQSEKVKQQIIQRNIENWGVDSTNKLEGVKNKKKTVFLEKWGVTNPLLLAENKEKSLITRRSQDYKIKKHNDNLERLRAKLIATWGNDFIDLDSDRNCTILCKDCNTKYIINSNFLFQRCSRDKINPCTNCNRVDLNSSWAETELYEWIKTITDKEIIRNWRGDNISEIDIYIPELGIGIEYNGAYWHSDKFKSSDYHIKKYEAGRLQNIQIINIWEWQWKDDKKREIIKSRLFNLINKPQRIGARKLKLEQVKFDAIKFFLEDNHLFGPVNTSINYVLKRDNDILACMTFSKRSLFGNTAYELVRYTVKSGYNIAGGAERLFKAFIKEYGSNVISYADMSWSRLTNNVYLRLGFRLETVSPNFVWVKNGDVRSRWQMRKHKIGLTTKDLYLAGWNRVWMCGNSKWVFELL